MIACHIARLITGYEGRHSGHWRIGHAAIRWHIYLQAAQECQCNTAHKGLTTPRHEPDDKLPSSPRRFKVLQANCTCTVQCLLSDAVLAPAPMAFPGHAIRQTRRRQHNNGCRGILHGNTVCCSVCNLKRHVYDVAVHEETVPSCSVLCEAMATVSPLHAAKLYLNRDVHLFQHSSCH